VLSQVKNRNFGTVFSNMSVPGASEKFRQPETLHLDDERWPLVVRVACSSQFRRAHRLREFLLYVCDKAVQGEVDRLTEHHIGQVVFDRAKDYSPAEDNVVRAHARQLRIKLAEYFAEHTEERLVVEIPKGSYVPVFLKRSEPAIDLPRATSTPREALTPVEPKPSVRRWAMPVLIVLCVVALSCCAYLLSKNRELSRLSDSASASSDALSSPLSWMFDEHLPTSVIVADSSFGVIQDVEGRTANLEEYLNPASASAEAGKSLSKESKILLQRLETRQFTSFADLILSERILRLAGHFRDRTTVRSARDLRMRDLASGNFIFLGSSYSNPWVSLFSKRRNFFVYLDAATRRGTVVNKTPRVGEPPEYVMKGEDGLPGPTYGVIAYLPSDAETGNVLLIEGINMEGTEAAGRYLTDSRETQELRSRLGLRDSRTVRVPLEVLLETRVVGGATRDTRIIATRKGNLP
jgi:hypothetical protein